MTLLPNSTVRIEVTVNVFRPAFYIAPYKMTLLPNSTVRIEVTFNVFNPVTATLTAPSLGKRPIHFSRAFFLPTHDHVKRFLVKMHSIKSKFIIGPSNITVWRRICVQFSALKCYRLGQ